MIALRTTALAAALSLCMVLPAGAQQAAPAAPAPQVAAVPTFSTPDLNAMVQRLKSGLESLTESARKGAESLVTRRTPYVITADQLAVIAASAVAGAMVIDAVGGGGLATLAGAAIGGVAGHWVYTQPEPFALPEIPAIEMPAFEMPKIEMPKMPALPEMPAIPLLNPKQST